MRDISFLEENGVDVKKSLELFDDIDKYNENLGTFLVGIHSSINKLIDLMQKKDLANYSVYAHSLKTDAKYFGFTKLAEKAYEHEIKGKSGDLYYITNNINSLIEETNKAIITVQKYMSEEPVNINTPVSKENIYGQKTILVVDDSNIIRNFVSKIFKDEYRIETAKNGEEAINIIKANQENKYIEAILLDLNMPKVDGFAVLEYMRDNDLLNDMPVSIISGDSSKETIDRAFTYDIVDMLSKPFNNQNIKRIVEKTILYKYNHN